MTGAAKPLAAYGFTLRRERIEDFEGTLARVAESHGDRVEGGQGSGSAARAG